MISLIGGGTALVCAPIAKVAADFLRPIEPRDETVNRLYAGRLAEFEIDSVTHIPAGRLYLSRTVDGLLALRQKCTHLGCAAQWNEDAQRFQCRCHGSEFDRVGDVLAGPAPRPLDLLPITIENEEVYIAATQPIERVSFEPTQLTRIDDVEQSEALKP
jgi:cytochrome b6-f complex iron-sulfur subunit